MFPKYTRSKYVVFLKVEGYVQAPVLTNSTAKVGGLSEMGDSSSEEMNPFLLEDDDDIGNMSKGKAESEGFSKSTGILKDDAVSTIFIPGALLLEDQIVEGLQLAKLDVLKIDSDQGSKMLGVLSPLNISTKYTAVKSGFVLYWRAKFRSSTTATPTGYAVVSAISFVTSATTSKLDLEKHLTQFGKLTPALNT